MWRDGTEKEEKYGERNSQPSINGACHPFEEQQIKDVRKKIVETTSATKLKRENRKGGNTVQSKKYHDRDPRRGPAKGGLRKSQQGKTLTRGVRERFPVHTD